MSIREISDYRSVLWLGLSIALVVVQYCKPEWIPYLCPFSCYFATACGTISHNHNHRPTFRSRRLNNAFGHLLTIFYGYPTLMWVPTHNLNHHKFVNRPGDATATWRYTNRHTIWTALAYPFMSAYFQSKPIKEYISRVRHKKPRLYRQIVFQYVFWLGTYVALLLLAAFLYHRQRTGMGLYVWGLSVLLPAVFSSTAIMFFNFIQHVHTDAWSDHDHSRNFTGRCFNFLFFNNGYHTAHHQNPAIHWSRLKEEHEAIADAIHPSLNERNLVWFLFRQYVLATVFPSLGTLQIGPPPGQPEPLLHGIAKPRPANELKG